MIKVKLFGIARDIVGSSSLDVEHAGTVAELIEKVKSNYPGFSKLTSLMVAVNAEYAELEDKINNNDEVALIPPVSGG